jgi:hypothetical protein
MTRILLFLFFSPLLTFAQKDLLNSEQRNHIDFTVGPTFPTGAFGSFDYSKGAFAQTGPNLNLFAFFRAFREINIVGSISYENYSVDEQNIVTALNQRVPSNYSVNTGNWTVLSFMFGPTYLLMKKGYALDFKMQVGIASCNSAALNVRDNIKGTFSSVTETNTNALIYGPGITFKKGIGEKIYFITNVDYLFTHPTFLNEFSTSSNGIFFPTFRQEISFLNVNLGLGFLLN